MALEIWSMEEVRGVICFVWAQKTAPIEIHRQHVQVSGTITMTPNSIRKWYHMFAGGQTSVGNDQHSGHPHLSTWTTRSLRRASYRKTGAFNWIGCPR